MKIRPGTFTEHHSPDERSGGAADAPKLKVGDKEFTLEEAQHELERMREFDRTQHERAEQNKRDRLELEERERRLQAELERANSINERAFSSLDQLLANNRQQEQAPARLSAREALHQTLADLDGLDPARDEDAMKKVKEKLLGIGDVLEQQEATFQQELQKRDQTWESRLSQVENNLTARLSQRDQQAAIDERNERIFSETINAKYPELTREEREEVNRLFRQKIGQDYGRLDPQAGRWLWNEKAVEDAVRSSSAFDRLQERRLAEARAEERRNLLQNLSLQEEAGQSTPGLSRPAARSAGDEAFLQKVAAINEGVKAGTISPAQASGMLSLEEKMKIRDLQRQQYAGRRAG